MTDMSPTASNQHKIIYNDQCFFLLFLFFICFGFFVFCFCFGFFFLHKSDQDYLLLLKSQDLDSWSESLSSIKTFAFELTEEDKLKHIKWNHLFDNSVSGCTPS